MGADQDWREQRRIAAAEHAAAHERRKAAESERAQGLVDDFVRAAHERGLRPEPLMARAYNGRASYRTGLTGWYIRRARPLAIGTDGRFYILTVDATLRGLFTGVTVPAEPPPLVIGAGGRDGESVPLDELLALRLDAGNDW